MRMNAEYWAEVEKENRAARLRMMRMKLVIVRWTDWFRVKNLGMLKSPSGRWTHK